MEMDSYYTQDELRTLGLKAYGEDVHISRKASIYGAGNISIGSHVRIDDFVFLSGHIEIGDYVHIAPYSALYGEKEGIFIGDFVGISSRVTIYSATDDYSGTAMTNPVIPEEFKNVQRGAVHIQKHALIGTTSVVLPGVTLREGSSFGCFSLIMKDSKEWSVNFGIPARKLYDRKKDLLKYEEDFFKEIR